MKRLTILGCLVLSVFFALAGTGWGAGAKLDINPVTPYVPAQIFDADTHYAYAWSAGHLVSYDVNYAVAHTGTQSMSDLGLSGREIFATSTPGKVFVCANDASSYNYIYVTEDNGDTFVKVCDLGDNNGTQITNVYLMQRGLCEATIGGQTVYLAGEYQNAPARTPGGANDKVRLLKIQKVAGNWTTTVLANWNTDGNHYMDHIHAVKFNYYNNCVYICCGDGGVAPRNDPGIVMWNPAVGVWADNLDFPALASRPGFAACYGTQHHRAIDLVFSSNYIHWATDTNDAGHTGIWRADQDLDNITLRNDDVSSLTGGAGWSGILTDRGNVIWTEEITSPTTDWQLRIWSSNDEGNTYQIVGIFGNCTLTSEVQMLRVCRRGADILLSSNNGAGKNYYETAIIQDQGTAFIDDFPTIFHPVYFVASTGTNVNTGSQGWTPDKPWLTYDYAMTANRITYGSRVIGAAGDYVTAAGLNPAWTTHGRPGTTGALTVMEGSGAQQSVFHTQLTHASVYVLYNNTAAMPLLINNMHIYARPDSTSVNTILLGAGATGINWYIRNSIIGSKLYNNAAATIKLNAAIDIANSKINSYTGLNCIDTNGTNASIKTVKNIYDIGDTGIYVNHAGISLISYNDDFLNYSGKGIQTGVGATLLPTIKNGIFFSTVAGAYDLVDSSGLTEDDAHIDYNCYSRSLVGIANSGGSHRVNGDPLFRDAASGDYRLQSISPCINAGVDVGLSYNGPYPDFGAYEHSSQASEGVKGKFQRYSR